MNSGSISQRLALTLLLTIFLAATWVIYAQPARDRIIAEATLHVEENTVLLEISLTYPFRYLSHFPPETGSELRIRLQPVSVPSSDTGAVFHREGLVPEDASIAAIDEVVYEGDAAGGPQLTVNFTRPVRYQVIPGNDYRRINVVILELD